MTPNDIKAPSKLMTTVTYIIEKQRTTFLAMSVIALITGHHILNFFMNTGQKPFITEQQK